MGGGAPTPRQTVCAGTNAWVCADTGVKMQSWLNLMQLEQRPSSVASKPEHRIYNSKQLPRAIARAITYLATSAVAARNGSALAGSGRLVVLLLDILRRRRWLLAIWVWWRRSARPLIGARQAIRLRLLLVVRMLGHVRSGLLGRRRGQRGVHLG